MITFNEYLISSVVEYPSLYSSKSYEITKFLVMDHAFNTIGTGVGEAILLMTPPNHQSIPEKYINGTELFYVYNPAITVFRPGTRIVENDHQAHMGELTYDELMQIPGMTEDYYFSTLNTSREHPLYMDPSKQTGRWQFVNNGPYPNFQKRYSLVWNELTAYDTFWNETTEELERNFKQRIAFFDLPDDWRDAAIEYYTQCKQYFQDDYLSSWYHSAFPEYDENAAKFRINDMTDYLSRTYGPDFATNQEVIDNITKGYGVKFTGSVEQLLKDRWKRTRGETIRFINQTLEHLTAR